MVSKSSFHRRRDAQGLVCAGGSGKVNPPYHGLRIEFVKDRITHNYHAQRFLAHRAATAFLAICLRFRADKAAARACPPLDAPSFDRATAAGFRMSGISAGREAWPVASWTICHAS